MRKLTDLYRMDLPHRAISVYIYLADRAGKKTTCWPSIPTINEEAIEINSCSPSAEHSASSNVMPSMYGVSRQSIQTLRPTISMMHNSRG